MKKIKLIPLILFICVLLFIPAIPASAHPADVYTHSIHVTIAKSGLSIKWEIKPGPMLISYIWFNADTDQDGNVSPQEANQWASSRVSTFTALLGNARLPLQFDDVQFPSTQDSFQAGQEFVTIHLSAVWPDPLSDSYQIALHNGMEEQKSLNWYFVDSQDGIKFQTPQQKNSNILLKMFLPSAQNSTQTQLIDTWDSSMPSLSSWQGGQQSTATPEPLAPTFQQNARQEMLLNLIRNGNFSIPFFAFALAVSLVLGALHALTPGHGKTVVAAYLVGSRGTTRHAIALGTIVTLTHTGSVFLLGLITLVASKYILPTSIIPVLEILSGLLIVGLGMYLLLQRFQTWRKQAIKSNPKRSFSAAGPRSSLVLAQQTPDEHTHPHGEDHHHNHDEHDHEHGHSHEVPETLTWRSLVAMGVSGGLVPCPDAIAILLVAVALNRILLGLALIVSFSLGLALVLIIIGLLMVNSRRLFDRFDVFSRFAPIMPIVSALVVVALGVGLTYGAYVRAKDGFSLTGAGASGINEAKVLYLSEDENKVTQLFTTDVKNKTPRKITQTSNGVIDYALSPDASRVLYILQTDDLENQIWLVDLSSGEDKKLSDCTDAICSGPVWSPDGNSIVFENMSLSASNATGLATLWSMDVRSGEAKPVFQESQLPGANPRWSPDGKWLSYATTDSVRLYNLTTGENHVINSILGAAANWSPDGKKILYRDVIIQDNQFITQLFVYNLGSQTKTNISPDLGFENILAAWSPDGTQIAVVRRDLSVSRGDQIWVMRADGTGIRALTGTPAVLHGSLNWSSDGKYLLYDLYQLDSFPLESSLQMIEVDSSKVTDLGIKGYNPKWLQ